MTRKEHRNALPLGYDLHWYRIERVLGQGGFGLTYLAQDINLDRLVAIKEYMPAQISMRETDNSIQPLSGEVEKDFKWGLKRFISEARTLTQFEHPNLVRVFNVFEANNSAYMVMSYVVGRSLRQLLRENQSFREEDLINLLFPLMDALETVHLAGFVHRDIKPGNVYIRDDGRPVLLDFGSARQTRGNFETKTLTNFVSPGYAPIEQYSSKSDRQGPWTDIYGLGATVYEVMTGSMPEAAIDRGVMISGDSGDSLVGVAERCKGRFSDKFLAAIDHALAFNVQDRPQSIAEWRQEFDVDPAQIENLTIPPGEGITLPARAIRGLETADELEGEDHPARTYTRNGDRAEQGSEGPTMVARAYQTTLKNTLAAARRNSRLTATLMLIFVLLAGVAAVRYWPVLQQRLPGTAESQPAEPDGQAASGGTEEADADGAGPPAPEQDAGVAEQQAPEPAPPAEPTLEERIEAILQSARQDLDALRLTTPSSSNAYDKYQEVLSLDNDNIYAQRGLDTISDKYIQFFYTNLEAGDLSRARYFLDKAWEVTPAAPKILVAQKSLQAALEERESGQANEAGEDDPSGDPSQGLFERVRGLFE